MGDMTDFTQIKKTTIFQYQSREKVPKNWLLTTMKQKGIP